MRAISIAIDMCRCSILSNEKQWSWEWMICRKNSLCGVFVLNKLELGFQVLQHSAINLCKVRLFFGQIKKPVLKLETFAPTSLFCLLKVAKKNSCYIDLFDAWSLDFQLTVLVCFYDWYKPKQIDIWKKLFQYENFWCMFLWWSKKYGSWVTSYQVNDGYWIISLSTLFLFVYWINTSVVYRVIRKLWEKTCENIIRKIYSREKNDPFR